MPITAAFFSPTHTTRKVVEAVAAELAKLNSDSVLQHNLTFPSGREESRVYERDDILVLGLPVYGGRIPALAEEALRRMQGAHTPIILVAVYGNRDFDDALHEMAQIMTEQHFVVLRAAAFIGEHSYTARLGAARPNKQDIEVAKRFAATCHETLHRYSAGTAYHIPTLPGEPPYKERAPHIPRAPVTSAYCSRCMRCHNQCPVDAIDHDDPFVTDPQTCIACHACAKFCPAGARQFEDERIKDAVEFLEANFSTPKDPLLF